MLQRFDVSSGAAKFILGALLRPEILMGVLGVATFMSALDTMRKKACILVEGALLVNFEREARYTTARKCDCSFKSIRVHCVATRLLLV